MKVLVADDSRVMRQIILRTLRQAGYGHFDYIEAADGVDALAKIAEHSPALVLSDWNMPNLTGIQLLHTLRAQRNGVRFGFVTSEGSQEMRAVAARAGASFLIAKPFTAESFRDALSGVQV